MGANQSRSFDFYIDFAISHSYIEHIENESPSRVYNRLNEGCLTTYKQMEAVSIMIYEKAILKTHLSLKCAQLVKELQVEMCKDDELDEVFMFHMVFADYLTNLIKTYAAVYDDSKMNDLAVQRGKSIATFIGNLYIADAFTLPLVIRICHMIKEKETRKNRFFIETIQSVISNKMVSEKVSNEAFNRMVTNGFEVTFNNDSDSDSDPEDEAMKKFSKYLDKICYEEHYEFYDNFRDFKNMSEKALEVEITILFKDAVKVENQKFTNAYRDIALDIHYVRPYETKNCLSSLFIKNIERYEVIKDLGNEHNLNGLNILGKTVTEFFQSGLLDERVVEHYLNAVKSPRVPGLIFTYTFIEVLKKYRGKNIYNYLDHFIKSAKKLHDSKQIIAAVDDYVADKEMEVPRNGKKLKRVGISAADLPDFREFSSKFLTTRSTTSNTFKCENRPSCHFASLRGIELLKRHIGHKFFTPERIETCVKMTKNSIKFHIGDDIGDIFVREMKTYLPFFHGDIEPSLKVTNFSNLMASLYEYKLINHAVLDFWFTDIFESIKDREHKFQDKMLEIYAKIFQKVSLQFLRDHPQAWELNLSILEAFEFKTCKFDDFEKFRDVFTIYKADPRAVHLQKLKNVKVPNNKFALKLISRFLLKLHTEDNMDALEISALIVSLPDEFKPSLDKNVLRSEFQDTLCVKLGHLSACCKNIKSDFYTKAENMIDLVEVLCHETIMTRLGLANLLNTIADLLNPNLYPVFELIKYFTEKISQFFIGAKPLPTKVEKILLEVIDKIKKAFENEKINQSKIKKVTNVYENILEDTRNKRKETDGKKQKQTLKSEQILKNDKDLRDSSVSPPASTAETSKSQAKPDRNVTTNQTKSLILPNQAESDSIVQMHQSKSASQSKDLKPSTSSSTQPLTPNQPQSQNDQKSTQTQPKKTQKDIKDYQDYCDYFNSIEHKTSDDDKFLFNPNFISTINIKNKEQVIDLAKKIIDQVLAAQSTVIFFVQNAQKIGNAIQSMFKLKNQKISFQKILADEICLKFENQEVLVKFMCELYNNSYVNKASMIAFVDKFKSQSPENLVLMHLFVRTCAIRLSSQGDKEQLMQIRTIARSIKNLTNYDEDLKFLAQDLANSTNSLILLLENGQNNKPQVVTESNEKLVDELLKNVLNNLQIYVKSAYKLDGKLNELLIQKIENIIKEVPKFSIKLDEFMNLIEFVAELYNLEFFKKDFLTKTIEIFMQSSTYETCSQSIEVLFTKCGQKLEIVNKHKFDIYMKFFEAVLVQENDTIRSECFKRIQKLRNRKWKILDVPKNYYEDFLMLFSMNDAKVEELIEILNCDDEEMEKFIQILWKIILKEAPHPFYAILSDELSKNCENFRPKLMQFFTTRCITFIGFTADMFNENVKERLGKVMTFVAEIYNNNLASDEVLEMYLDQKLTSKLPTEFVTRIFSILSKCGRLEESKNDRLKDLVKNFDDFYHRGIDAQLESIRKGLDSISKRVI